MAYKEGLKGNWVSRLRAGLTKTASKVGTGVGSVFSGGIIDDATLAELEEVLIGADFGVGTSQAFIKKLSELLFSILFS